MSRIKRLLRITDSNQECFVKMSVCGVEEVLNPLSHILLSALHEYSKTDHQPEKKGMEGTQRNREEGGPNETGRFHIGTKQPGERFPNFP
jgi:hypothetical protein